MLHNSLTIALKHKKTMKAVMKDFCGTGTSLETQIQGYLDQQHVPPTWIRTLSINTIRVCHPQQIPSIVVLLLYYPIEPEPGVNYNICQVKVVCEGNLNDYSDKVSAVISNRNDLLWFSHEAIDDSGTYYWIGIFAP
jgi:hypothetical protein